jgi:hypothetical protein
MYNEISDTMFRFLAENKKFVHFYPIQIEAFSCILSNKYGFT